jgi:opacity protein-like surface antigen
MRLKSLIPLSVAAIVLAPGMSLAADYDPPVYVDEAPEFVPVEVGSGWYLRGDVSYTANKPFEYDAVGTVPGDVATSRIRPFGATVGMGYHFNDYLRAEVNFGIQPSQEASLVSDGTDGLGAFTATSRTKNSMYSGMVNVYGDLGTIAGFTPYVGAGIGMVSTKRSYEFSQVYPLLTGVDIARLDSARDYDYAYTVGAGVSYNFTPSMAIDVGYQYFAAPNSEYYRITGPTTATLEKGIDFHQIKVGLRYDLW